PRPGRPAVRRAGGDPVCACRAAARGSPPSVDAERIEGNAVRVPSLPSGTVTFLFSDIEGSTRLLRRHGDDYAGLLAEHRRLLRSAFAEHGGVEVDTQGDAFFVASTRVLRSLG